MSKNFIEAYRYILVGICSVAIDFIFYYIFINLNIFDPNNSKRLSFIIGALFAFFANRNYVFQVREKKISQFFYFCVLYLISFILNSVIHDLVYFLLNNTFVSFLSATAASTLTNYVGQKFIIYRKKNYINKND